MGLPNPLSTFWAAFEIEQLEFTLVWIRKESCLGKVLGGAQLVDWMALLFKLGKASPLGGQLRRIESEQDSRLSLYFLGSLSISNSPDDSALHLLKSLRSQPFIFAVSRPSTGTCKPPLALILISIKMPYTDLLSSHSPCIWKGQESFPGF